MEYFKSLCRNGHVIVFAREENDKTNIFEGSSVTWKHIFAGSALRNCLALYPGPNATAQLIAEAEYRNLLNEKTQDGIKYLKAICQDCKGVLITSRQ